MTTTGDTGAAFAGRPVEELTITTLRTMAIDAVERAGSGYPGTAMALAPVVYNLWVNHLRYDPDDPDWVGRDRFVLSVGHASILLYSILHLAEVKSVDPRTGPVGQPAITLEDLRTYRRQGTRATGHPEHGVTAGVETTTGPLGQGLATSVGMAMAQRWKAAQFAPQLFDYDVVALGGDGDFMEGVSYEAGSLAGHQRLANLCWIYDNNGISIEGSTDLAFTEDVGARLGAAGWQVLRVDDANDCQALSQAYAQFKATTDRPTLIIVDSVIGWGSPNRAGKQMAHGMPLGPDEQAATKQALDWPVDSELLVPAAAKDHVHATLCARGRMARQRWNAALEALRSNSPEQATELEQFLSGELPAGWDQDLPTFEPGDEPAPTRVVSGQVANTVGPRVKWLVGGAADTGLPSSSLMWFPQAGGMQADSPGGRNIHFGVREHAMGAAINGLALSGLRPFGASYMVFTDYGRGAVRLSALMGLPVLHVFTHDSFEIGGDGPTHQPVEHLASYRAIPNLVVIRPADANETVEAWRIALAQTDRPVILSLSARPLPVLDRAVLGAASGIRRGGYVLRDPDQGEPEGILIATGGEVHLALAAQAMLAERGVPVRVVNLASWELFDAQPDEYRHQVLPPQITARVSIEEQSTMGWERYVGDRGTSIGFDTFGMSAAVPELQAYFGFTADHIVDEMVALLS